MKVKLKHDPAQQDSYPDLRLRQEYEVLGIEADDYRIVTDLGRPFLFDRNDFDTVDPSEPPDWISRFGESGERYAYPPELGEAGFFEDYFDRRPDAVRRFNEYVSRRRHRE